MEVLVEVTDGTGVVVLVNVEVLVTVDVEDLVGDKVGDGGQLMYS